MVKRPYLTIDNCPMCGAQIVGVYNNKSYSYEYSKGVHHVFSDYYITSSGAQVPDYNAANTLLQANAITWFSRELLLVCGSPCGA